MLQLSSPAVAGVKRTVIVADSPGPSETEAEPSIEKSGQLSDRVRSSVPPPTFLMVKVRVALCPTATMPNDRLVGETLHCGPGGGLLESPCPVTANVPQSPIETVHGREPAALGEKWSVKVLLSPAARE